MPTGWPTYATREHAPLKRGFIRAVEQLTGRVALGRRYDRALHAGETSGFFGRVVRELKIEIDLPPAHEAHVPRDGPLLMIANHPFGVVDGLILCDLAARTRGDFKILLHMGLCREPALEPYLLPVDMAPDEEAQKTNRSSIRLALQELRKGGTLLLFPAGGISTAVGLRGPVTDLAWHPLVAKLFRSSKSPVLPVHFAGANSRLFHTVSQFSPTMRASILLREQWARRGAKVSVRVGEPLTWSDAFVGLDDAALSLKLRETVYETGRR
ncbi:MAG: lysophospholipid acyltransferase family protein [Myxococcota bacterium]